MLSITEYRLEFVLAGAFTGHIATFRVSRHLLQAFRTEEVYNSIFLESYFRDYYDN